ncbi:MAG TPA: NAD(P)/FAD-dependent oxidoreductase [Solirubrobacterales bacterium]|nr:NAD(P)/FAD-dependent oxidoreductase [Solirubrobacterales bacterium]
MSGGGFGGFYAARTLERLLPRQSARITLVNDVNFLLYTPFLPEAAAGTLEPRHVVTPLRDVLSHSRLRIGAVTARDPARQVITMVDQEGHEHECRYDRLVVAHGSVSRVLPIPGLEEHAIGFKSLSDAIWLRNHVIQCLEMADATDSPRERDELLTFVVVGGGYAGLEALAEVQDFAADAIEQYPSARLHGMQWMLVEAMDRVLPEIDLSLAEYAVRELRSRGIDIRLGTTLEELTANSVRLATGEVLPTRTVVWTAGVTAHPSIRNLGLPTDVRGRIVADEYLRVPSEDNVWALGDCAAVPDPRPEVEFCPPTSQHAVRQGKTAGRNVAASLGIGAPRPFRYKSMGQFANLGRYKAVAKVFRFQLRGFPAWWLARTYHLSQIPGTARKVRAVMDWTVGLPFQRDIAEVGTIGQPRPLRADAYERAGTHRA